MLPLECFTMPFGLTAKEGEVPQNADLFLSVPFASIAALFFGLMIVFATEPAAQASEEPVQMAANTATP